MRSRTLGLGHHLDDLRQHHLRADTLGPHHQRASGVHGRTDELVAGHLHHGHRLTGEHGLIHGAAPFDDAGNRDRFTGSHPQ